MITHLHLFVAAPAAVVAFSVCACDKPDRGFKMYFEEVERIQLEDFAQDPIVGIHQVSRRPAGGLALADQGAARVRLFDSNGRQEEVLGRRGDGPGEFRTPTAVVELATGQVAVTDGADPTLTIFGPGRRVQLGRIPGQYGLWLGRIDDRIVAGLGSRGNRFAILTQGGEVISTFGAVRPEVNEVPFWIFFARDRATVAGNRIVVNTSFYPTFRIFSSSGDSLGTFGSPPPFWTPAATPPIDYLANAGDRDRIADWSRGFTVVRQVATVGDTLVVVQYGSHDPQDRDPYYVRPEAIDVYALDGAKVAEAVEFSLPIIGGGTDLLVLSAQPPDPWTITVYRWRGE